VKQTFLQVNLNIIKNVGEKIKSFDEVEEDNE